MAMMETVRHTGTVIHEFHHVTAEVRLLIDSQSVGATVLLGQRKRTTKHVKITMGHS